MKDKLKAIVIILYIMMTFFIYKGFDKMLVYKNDSFKRSNAYVGGDAYNYIINSNYAVGYFILGIGLGIIATLLLVYSSRTKKNESNENQEESIEDNSIETTTTETEETTTEETVIEESTEDNKKSNKNLIIGGIVIIIAICLIAYAVANGSGSNVEITVNEVDTTYGVVMPGTTEEAATEEQVDEVPEFTQLAEPKKGETIATIETSMGNVVVKFLPEVAPLAVENFLTHARDGYYDGMVFHRVIDDFVIQSGDPTATGMGGESIWNMPFVNEVSPVARHFNGALAMANSGENTNGSQFYIVRGGELSPEIIAEFEGLLEMQDEPVGVDAEDNEVFVKDFYPTEVINGYLENSGMFQLDFGYTVFGQVIEGLEVVESIQKVETDENDKPVEDVIINKITLSTY